MRNFGPTANLGGVELHWGISQNSPPPFSVTILVLIIMSLNLQPAIAITGDSLSRPDKEAAIEAQIDAYIKLKYETMHTLVPQDFSSLVGDSREAKSFLQSEM